jgi:Anti-sigma factor NepR
MTDDSKPENPAKNPGRGRPGMPMEANLRTYKVTARLGHDVQVKIGQQLRAIYADVVDQGVPDRFAELIRRLDEARQKKDEE